MAEGIWQRLRIKMKLYGPLTLVGRIIKRGLSVIGISHEAYLYCVFDVEQPFKERQLPEGYLARKITLDDLRQHSDIAFSPQKLQILESRFSQPGNVGLGIFYKERLVGMAWLSFTRMEVPYPQPENDTLDLNSDEGYLFDAYSHEDHRGKGFHPYYTWWRYNEIKNAGRRYAVTIIDVDNRTARTNQAKSGLQVKKRIIVNKLFGKTSCRAKPSSEKL